MSLTDGPSSGRPPPHWWAAFVSWTTDLGEAMSQGFVKEAHAVTVSVWLGDTVGLAKLLPDSSGQCPALPSAIFVGADVSLPIVGVGHDADSPRSTLKHAGVLRPSWARLLLEF
jgi:hypothetical protein